MKGLKGKTAIVTGGAGGIGTGICERLAEEGVRVVVCDVMEKPAAELAERLCAGGAEAVALKVDLLEEKQIKDMIDFAVKRFGRLDILVNNAMEARAEYVTRDLDCVNMEAEVFKTIMDVNMLAQLLACKYAVPAMISSGGGAIVNMSSINGLEGDTARYAYTASKAAINTLTRNVATSYGKNGIRCNSVLPGMILHERLRKTLPDVIVDLYMQNILTINSGYPKDIAAAVAFLASDDAAFITGQTLQVDGGITCHSAMLAQINALSASAAYISGDE